MGGFFVFYSLLFVLEFAYVKGVGGYMEKSCFPPLWCFRVNHHVVVIRL